ncbi:MAG: PDZ domain-containing protein [Gemmatimonadaceae bacterium]
MTTGRSARVWAMTLVLPAIMCRLAGTAAAQQGVGGTSVAGCAAERRIADLGITGVDCVECTIHASDRPGDAWVEFLAEPRVSGVERRGAADGVLEAGDVLVAVDGTLITTAAGARHFARLEPGRPVMLTIRRGGREQSVEIVPMSRCGPVRIPGQMVTGDSLSYVTGSGGRGQGRSVATTRPSRPPGQRAERGSFGFGIVCRGSCRSSSGPDGAYVWRFDEPPQVAEVVPWSPASLAGLREGDVLVAIGGVSLSSAEGGRLFSAIVPGQRVRWTYERDGKSYTSVMTAERAETLPGQGPNPGQRQGVGIGVGSGVSMGVGGGIGSAPARGDGEFRLSGRVGTAEVWVSGAVTSITEDDATGDLLIRGPGYAVRVRRVRDGVPARP